MLCASAPLRAGYEQSHAGDEHPLAPEPIAERGARHQQHREAQHVRVDGPLEARERCVQMNPDRAQRRRDD
jgi:hypothetical protein